MNDKFNQLYNYLKSNGMTDLDAQSFYDTYRTDSSKLNKLYGYLKSNGMTDLDPNSFRDSYFGANQSKQRWRNVTVEESAGRLNYRKDDFRTWDIVEETQKGMTKEERKKTGFDYTPEQIAAGKKAVAMEEAPVIEYSDLKLRRGKDGVFYKVEGNNWYEVAFPRDMSKNIINESVVSLEGSDLYKINDPKKVESLNIEFGEKVKLPNAGFDTDQKLIKTGIDTKIPSVLNKQIKPEDDPYDVFGGWDDNTRGLRFKKNDRTNTWMQIKPGVDSVWSVVTETMAKELNKRYGGRYGSVPKQADNLTQEQILNKTYGQEGGSGVLKRELLPDGEVTFGLPKSVENASWFKTLYPQTMMGQVVNAEEARRRGVKSFEENVQRYITNNNIANLEEEEVVKMLTNEFGRFGFEFIESGAGDEMIVRTKDGSREILINLDTEDPSQNLRLQDFLIVNQDPSSYEPGNQKYAELINRDRRLIYSNNGSNSPSLYKDLQELFNDEDYKIWSQNLPYGELEQEVNQRIGEYRSLMNKPGVNSSQVFKDMKTFEKSPMYQQYQKQKKEAFELERMKMQSLYDEVKLDPGPNSRARQKVRMFLSDKYLDKTRTEYNAMLNDINQSAKFLKTRYDEYNAELQKLNTSNLTPEQIRVKKEQLDKMALQLDVDRSNLVRRQKAVTTEAKQLEYLTGKYVVDVAKEGGFIGGLMNSFSDGISKMIKTGDVVGRLQAETKGSQIADNMTEEEKRYYKTKGYSLEEIKIAEANKAWKESKEDLSNRMKSAIGDLATTKQYQQSEDRGIVSKALFGLAESLPAMATSVINPYVGFGSLSAQAYSSLEDEMLNDPDFETTSLTEMNLIALPYAMGMGALEKIGLSSAMSKNPLAKSLIMKSIQGAVKKTTGKGSAELLQNVLDKEIKSNMAKFGLRIVGGALTEAETGATQSLVLDIGYKSLINEIKKDDRLASELTGGEFFDTPDSFMDGLKMVIEDGIAEGIGGMVMSGAGAISQKVINGNISLYDNEDVDFLKTVSTDNELRKMIVTKLKGDMLSGKITKSEAQNQLNALDKVGAIFNAMPDNLSVEDQVKSVNLMSEKQRLEKEIDGKDQSLVAAQKERITEIDNELQKISKDAFQKQATGEVPVQPEARVGEEVEGREPETKLEEVTKEGKEVTIDKPIIATNTTAELDRVKSVDMETEDGATFNIDGTKYEGGGLVVPIVSENTTVEEITPEMISDFVEKHSSKIGDQNTVKVGIYKFPNSNKVSIDLNIVAPESSRQQAIEFAKAADQESLFDLSTFENVKTGGTGVNPTQFTDEQFKEIAKALNEGRTPSFATESEQSLRSELKDLYNRINKNKQEIRTRESWLKEWLKENKLTDIQIQTYNFLTEDIRRYIEEFKSRVDQIKAKIGDVSKQDGTQNLVTLENVEEVADKRTATATKLVLNALPDVKIYIHNTNEEYSAAIGEEAEAGDRGAYDTQEGAIHINLEAGGNAQTVFHEAIHHALLKKGMDSGAILDLANGLNRIITDKKLKKRLSDFISQYETSDQAEEYVSELGAIMAEAEIELTTTKFNQFKALIARIFQKLGLPKSMVPFLNAMNSENAVDFINSLTKSLRTGENIMTDGFQSTINPTNKIKKQVEVKEGYKLSYVKQSDIIDIQSLISDIASNDQNVWFWVADQLGRGFVEDDVIDGKHYLDAGPSFALDPKNRERGIIWASGANPRTLQNNINKSDYIFIISGSPQKSKLFNKTVSNLVRSRIEKSVDFDTFKKSLIEANAPKDITSILEKYNSYDDLFNGPDRKAFLIAIGNQANKKATKSKQLLESYNAFVDYDSLRDDFYRENGFEMGDIMLVLKPTGVGEKSDHSTYENNILGEVVGVPDSIINSYDILPEETRNKYKEDISRAQQQQVVAPYGMGVSKVKKQKLTPENSSNYANLTEDDNGNFVFFHIGGNNYDVIKRSAGGTTATSRSEAQAIGKVGGVAMYYTRPEDSETMVSGTSKYAVKIPSDKVYDFNTDSENFIEQARARFNEEYPNQAFDPNTQLAYVTKIAAENGYDMTVAQWGDRTRAQTTLELKPDDVQITEANAIKKPFDNNYESNTTKGYQSVVPIGKRKMLEELFNEIYKERRDESRYDDLYHLPETGIKYSDAELTDLIMNSDISTEIKNQFKDIMNTPVEKRKSIKKQKPTSKQEAIQKAKDKYELSVEKRGNSHEQGVASALGDLQKSDWFANADDTAREDAVREIKAFFGEKIKKAPSVAKILGKPKPETQTKTVDALRKEFFTAWNKASREAKADLNSKRKAIGAIIKSMVRSGKITTKQSAVITDRASSINLDNPVIVQRFLDYVAKVFADANYQEKLSNAFSARRAIRRLTKSNNQAEVIGMAKAFLNIDPSMVEDIDTYNEIADSIKNAMAPSVVRGEQVKFKQPANISDVNEYTMDEISRQEEIKKDQLLAEYDYLKDAGLISKDMTLNEIRKIIEDMKSTDTDINDDVKDFVERRLDMMLGIVESIIRNGINPITGESMEVSDKNKDILKAIMKMDLKELDTRSLIYLSESVDNFLNNGITSGLEANVQSYVGAMKVKALVNAGVKSVGIKTKASKIASTEILSIPLLFEKLFRGTTIGTRIMSDMGLLDMVNGKNKAELIYNKILESYTKQDFYGKDFMTQQNIIERGMLAYLMRNVNGDNAQVKAELNRRIDAISESIEQLKEGNSDEQKLAEMYENAFSKLKVNSRDIDIIRANSSKSNREAVDWWVDQWKQHYTDLYDVSLSVYNTMLSSDINYTPDKMKLMASKAQDDDITSSDSGFVSSLGYTDTKKAGVLMENVRKKPKNRYVDLNFDMNNANSLRNALVDINTAAAIRQVKGFMDSNNFDKLAGDESSLIKSRVNSYVKRMKGKRMIPRSSADDIMKYFNAIAKAGTIRALGGIGSAIKQFSPVINTLLNAGRFTSLTPNSNAWIDRLGMPISNRGIKSEANIDTIDKRVNVLADSAVGKVYDGVGKIGDMWLKALIQSPDAYVAKSSFITYYLKSLRDQGLSTNIDWNNHEVNKKAAEYAQMQVDRQQNVSDPLLTGELFATEDATKKMITKLFMPFTSFVWNQRARMINDMQILGSKVSSKEDKIIAMRSLAALPAEIVVFNLLGAAIRKTIDAITNYFYGEDDDEEEEVLFYVFGMKVTEDDVKEFKMPIKNLLVDLFSPLPGLTDEFLVTGFNNLFEMYPLVGDDEIAELVKAENDMRIANGDKVMTEKQEAEFIEEEKKKRTFQLYENMESTGWERYIPGAPGVALKTYSELKDAIDLAMTGKYEDEYQGRKSTKYISEEDRKKVAYGLFFQIPQAFGLLPREAGQIPNKGIRNIKKRSYTENQKTKMEEVEKLTNRPIGKIEKVLIGKNSDPKKIAMEMKMIDKLGGFDEKQEAEYAKLRRSISKPSMKFAQMIKGGMTAEDIIRRIAENKGIVKGRTGTTRQGTVRKGTVREGKIREGQ